MLNNRSKLIFNCKSVGSDKLGNLSRSGGKLGHVDGNLVEGLSRK